MFLNRRRVVYEGKAKVVYEGPEPGTFVQHFKDDATAFNGQKHAVISGKGVLNNRISAHIMSRLETIGIPTHFIRQINMREQLIRQLEIIPVEVVVRNIAAGSLCKKYGLTEGSILPRPIIEFYYKRDDLGDPMVSEDHIMAFGWMDPYEMDDIIAMSWRINDYLNGLFSGVNLKLVDFKMEFGRVWSEQGDLYLFLADEISPDTCRLWDSRTGEKFDKDRFRLDLGNVIEGYQEIARRLGLVPEGGIIAGGSINEQLAASLEEIENELAGDRQLRGVAKPPQKPRKV